MAKPDIYYTLINVIVSMLVFSTNLEASEERECIFFLLVQWLPDGDADWVDADQWNVTLSELIMIGDEVLQPLVPAACLDYDCMDPVGCDGNK